MSSCDQNAPITHPIGAAVCVEYYHTNGRHIDEHFQKKAALKSSEILDGDVLARHFARMAWLDKKKPLNGISRCALDNISAPGAWDEVWRGKHSPGTMSPAQVRAILNVYITKWVTFRSDDHFTRHTVTEHYSGRLRTPVAPPKNAVSVKRCLLSDLAATAKQQALLTAPVEGIGLVQEIMPTLTHAATLTRQDEPSTFTNDAVTRIKYLPPADLEVAPVKQITPLAGQNVAIAQQAPSSSKPEMSVLKTMADTEAFNPVDKHDTVKSHLSAVAKSPSEADGWEIMEEDSDDAAWEEVTYEAIRKAQKWSMYWPVR